MADIDILVAPDAVDDAVAALTARGLERSRHDTALHVVFLHPQPGQPRATALELHRDILDPPHPFELGLPEMLARATPDPASGLFLPTPADALTLACVHLLFHEHDARKTLLTLRDIAHLSRVLEPGSRGEENTDHGALVSGVAERAIAWAGADAARLAATPREPSTWSRRIAVSAALRELDAGLVDPGGARWRVVGRRLGCALWWPRVPQRLSAVARLVVRASPGALGRAARGLWGAGAASGDASGRSGAAKRG